MHRKGGEYISMSNLHILLKEYERNRTKAEYLSRDKKEQLYHQYPRLADIDLELSQISIATAKQLLVNNDASLLTKLNEKIAVLRKEKQDILSSIHLTEKDLQPQYRCSVCQDTGYIQEENAIYSVMCNCLKQRLYDLEYNKCNMANLDKQNFKNFCFDYYSTQCDEQKYKAKISPRENIEKIYAITSKFIENFDSDTEKNLLFTGNTGLGKTFLSSCIANEILKKGKTVLYQTASNMLDTIIDYRFGKSNVSPDMYQNLLTVDLLIIDDLGTESMNQMKFAELFNVLNTRLLQQNKKAVKTIISTNLTLQNLFAKYDERIVSRLVGNYNICYFFGEDIRFKTR